MSKRENFFLKHQSLQLAVAKRRKPIEIFYCVITDTLPHYLLGRLQVGLAACRPLFVKVCRHRHDHDHRQRHEKAESKVTLKQGKN